MSGRFDICIVGQAGRLSYEAVLFAASLRCSAPEFRGRLIVGEPNPGPLWPDDPRIEPEARDALQRLGAEIHSFDSQHFGARYPYGNKVEMLATLPPDQPFVFFDTDTLILGPVDRVDFDFDRPAASMARENTWPVVPLYGPGLASIWEAVFDRASVALEPTLDLAQPADHWERYLYFNAGWFFYRCPQVFGARMIALMTNLRDDPPDALACQSLDPWLDQIALPAVVAGLGGGRPGPELEGLDGEISYHWRTMPLFYARACDATLAVLEEIAAPHRIKKVLKTYEPFRRTIYQGRGRKIRDLFDRADMPTNERAIRNRIKRARLWLR